MLLGCKVPLLTALLVTLGGHSVVVLLAGSATVAGAVFVLVLGAAIVGVVTVLDVCCRDKFGHCRVCGLAEPGHQNIIYHSFCIIMGI